MRVLFVEVAEGTAEDHGSFSLKVSGGPPPTRPGWRLWLNRGTHENYQIKKPHLFLCFSCFILRSDFSFQDPVKIRL